MKQDLNLLKYSALVKQRQKEDKLQLYDVVRKKYIAATPEEWVRQLYIHYLLTEKKISKNKIAVEKQLIINDLQRRFDIVIFDDSHAPFALIECKAPHVKLNDDVFRQAAHYNQLLRAPWLVITNGMDTCYCTIDFLASSWHFSEGF